MFAKKVMYIGALFLVTGLLITVDESPITRTSQKNVHSNMAVTPTPTVTELPVSITISQDAESSTVLTGTKGSVVVHAKRSSTVLSSKDAQLIEKRKIIPTPTPASSVSILPGSQSVVISAL